MMDEPRIVCKICYASSSHKPSPTLTPENKTISEGGTRKCSVCHQGWAPIRVAKDSSAGGRWVRIRPRPRIGPSTEFQMCKNVQGGRVECPRGLDCSYAHSRTELGAWNAERKQEPRPAPAISAQYQFCKHIQGGGGCPYGQRCTFAHSEEELQEWFRVVGPRGPAPSPAPSGFGGVGGVSLSGVSLRCDLCVLSCTSRKQLEDHLAGAKHRDRLLQLGEDDPHPAHTATPSHPHTLVRRKPLLSFHIVGFKMCMHVVAGRRCVYGEYCTFAHSNEELQEWNRLLATPTLLPGNYRTLPQRHHSPSSPPLTEVKGRVIHNSVEHQKPDMFTESSGLDDFGEDRSPQLEEREGEGGREEGEGEMGDFADELRRRIEREFDDREEINGFQESLEGVSVVEVSGQDLCLTWTQPDSLHWTFHISSSVPGGKVLQSVVLFDALATDFTILGAWLLPGGAHQLHPLSGSSAHQGAGLLLQQRVAPPDIVQIKVSLKPRSGVLGQLVVFDFGNVCLVRGLSVHVLNEMERGQMVGIGQPREAFRPAKPDLYWEQHYTKLALPGREEDEIFDSGLSEYPLPEQIERLIDAGKYNNVENRVTQENYKRRLHNLLYLEEYQQRLDMSRYDIYDIEIQPEVLVQTPHWTVYASEGCHYITVSVEEVLFEGGRSIRSGDSCLLLPMNQQVIHECWIETVGRDRVTLKISEKAKQASASSRNRCSLRFVLSRTHMREMHYAVDKLDLSVVFPHPQPSSKGLTNSQTMSKCLHELKNTRLNQSQKNAISSMLDPACQQIPSLVLGPFGCGKTRTLRECILLLSLLPDPTILICTHSNSAANIYIQDLGKEFAKRDVQVSMIRIYYTGRRVETIPHEVRPYCKFENGRPALPTLSELKQYRVVVVTLSTSRILSLMGLPRGHFSFIFIDEAAQALESEALIPLILAGEGSKVVLAGDHMQMDPPCYSTIARRYGLHVSLLERLFDHEAYSSGIGRLCKTLLTENHRSHEHIMEIPSRLFYKSKLTCRAKFPSTGPHQSIPPLKFIGVDGQEAQDEDSPSYYNNHEALKITEQVKMLVSGGLKQDEVCVLAYYQKQVTRIRHLLRNERLGQVAVFRVEDVQGKEFRALLLSTVRTCYGRDDKDLEEDAGFLTNPKLFNTAVTRAREWLVVCGEPVTLCTVGSNRLCWIELIKKCLHQLGSFEYPNAAQFESLLQTKLFTRKVLEKRNGHFFQQIKKTQPALAQPAMTQPAMTQPPMTQPAMTQPAMTQPAMAQPPMTQPPMAAVHQVQPPPPSPPPPSNPTPQTPPSVRGGQGFAGAPGHVRHQMIRSSVVELAQGSDELTINKITEELLKLSVQEQASLVARPDILKLRVREIENVLRRPGPTAALLNSTTAVPNPILGQGPISPALYPMTVVAHKYAPDLPPFLTSIIDGLTNYMKWCDMHLHNPQNNRPGLKENLARQRENLARQSELVNQQITMYRELLQIVRTSAGVAMETPGVRGMAPQMISSGQGPPPPQFVQERLPSFPPPPPPPHQVTHHQLAAAAAQHQMRQEQLAQTQAYQPPGPTASHTHQGTAGHTHQGTGGHTHQGPGGHTHQGPGGSNSNSAFAYGMTSYLPKAEPDGHPHHVSVQTNLPPSQSKRLSPLEAAINDVRSRASPQPLPDEPTTDLYLSDNEFNS